MEEKQKENEIKQCVECGERCFPGLVIAMEQREHFALTRHTFGCDKCAGQLLQFIDQTAAGSRHYRQCVNCIYCGSNLPITRLRFQIKDQHHRHVAICEECYKAIRDEMLKRFPAIVGFIELEWQTVKNQKVVRTPWPMGSFVRVRSDSPTKYAGQTGKIVGFRPLSLPWFGYDVVFVDGKRHFYHERDLERLTTPDFETVNRFKDVG